MLNLLDLTVEEDLNVYKSLISRKEFQSAYNRIEYLEVFCGGKKGLVSFVYRSGEDIILLPGYLKNIKIYNSVKEHKDFVTPYGYTGPFLSENITSDTIKSFWIEVLKWQLNNNIVSEFIRFNLFNNYQEYNGTVKKTMLNVKGRIVFEDEQWRKFEAKVRKNVKRAQREGLESRIHSKEIPNIVIEEFYSIYIDTMKRTNASEFFFYSLESFERFILANSELCAICNIYDGEKAVSSELLLISNNSIFSFLGGTLPESFDKRANDFLKYEVINWARINAFDYYVLGGGYGYEDGIFKYKKAFFPEDIIEYVTGRKIVNEMKYLELIDEVNNQKLDDDKLELSDDSFFPLYNKQ